MMRFLDFAVTGFLSAAVLTACSGSTVLETGVGGGGEGGATTTTTGTTTTFTPTTTTTSSSTGTGGDKGMPSDDYPAPHPDPPKVVTYGGPVLKNPNIIQVFFGNYDPDTEVQLKDYAAKVATSQYWATTTAEYGVGPATVGPSVDVTDPLADSIDDKNIQSWLRGKLNGDDPSLPAADANSLYVLHYPEGTVITASGDESCVSFGGYHSSVKLDAAHGGRKVAYAVIPWCGSFAGFDGIDGLTVVESHELIEAASDPYPNMDPAYASCDDANLYWTFALGGSENADMCAQEQSSFTYIDELPYAIQRSWSNVAAKAGHDPCVPAFAGEVYFNAAPELSDKVELELDGGKAIMKGVHIPVGEKRTIVLHLFSDGDTGGPWDLDVSEHPIVFGQSGSLGLELDRYHGENGEKLYLTITVYEPSPFYVELFRITSYLNGVEHHWFGAVGN